MKIKNADKTMAPPALSSNEAPTAGGGIAYSDVHRLLHQLNQPITAIGNYAQAGIQLIDQGMSDSARLKELLEKIAAQSARTTACSHDLSLAVSELAQRNEQ